MEALSPRDANAQKIPREGQLKTKAIVQLAKARDKEHPPPPPNNVTEPPSSDRREGALYQVGKLLGKGGFAICYEGKLAGTSKRYALKIVKCQMPAKMEQKFQTELQIHSKMRHVNIVQFHRAFTFENCTYLVLELCPNGSLMDMVKRRKGLTEPEVRFYSVQIAGAIKYMHSKGIIHRDLKMGNIFLDKTMNAKIGDFGLAALLLTGKDMQVMRRTTLCGTPNYIAPEILEKGKKGHDHMVDIWSLGIIVYAMLTSKPPFQSATTDEIYRRARERDYEWPTAESSQKYISQEAKDLVADMLQEADKRPEPDNIVTHPFFTSGYMPVQSDITFKLRDFPPENPAFYVQPLASSKAIAANVRNLQDMCIECRVGPWNEYRFLHRNIWKEMVEEETRGLTPIIPLAEGIVYRPYEEIQKEQKLRIRLAMQQSKAQQSLAESSTTSQLPCSSQPATTIFRAPPQSFAAQQRAQNRPSNSATIARSQTVTELASRTTSSFRSRTRKEEAVPALAETVEPATTAIQATRTQGLRKVKESAPTPALPTVDALIEKTQQLTLSRPSSTTEKQSLFSPSERPERVPGTQPDVVLDRLRKLQAELERALNARTMAIISLKSKPVIPPTIVVKWVDYTNKFGLGYILNDGSVGCILRNIPVPDVSTGKTKWLPPSCLLVHGAERHCLRKDDVKYKHRHEAVPMNEGIYFYENAGEDGIVRVRVSPEEFRMPVNEDGTVSKMTIGRNVWDHRKRERIVLWKKFANYMITYGREIDDEILPPTMKDPSKAPSDVVSFYQRFGDAGCWIFCDGHMQFNFPDHTKIVIDPTGTWCHFWHLPIDAARHLEETGALLESALDQRSVLSYPVQTLLNFTTVAKQPGSSSRVGTHRTSNPATRRHRPEIHPDIQGIPAANHFRKKIEFIRDVLREWTSNGGIGNSDMRKENRIRYYGVRETSGVPVPSKHVWVTIGARWGDERWSAYVDPRRPREILEDIDEIKRAGSSSGDSARS